MMSCCSECFESPYLKSIVSTYAKIGDCDFCGAQNVATCDPTELLIQFQPVMDLYITNDKNGLSLEDQIENDFPKKIFSARLTVANRKTLLKEIILHDYQGYKDIFENKVVIECLNDKENADVVKPLELSWDQFSNELKWVNRFHIQNALDLERLKSLLKRYEDRVVTGRKFYRARLSGVKGFPTEQMGNPIAEYATGGRANPPGISYLYVADSIDTTLYEIRSSLYDYASIGEFELLEDLRVVNLRGNIYDPIYLAEQGELEDFLIHLPFTSKLEKELAKPRRRSDNELDYLPTQYLSEYIKAIGFDGVVYSSSLHSKGYNLAVFKSEKFKCISSKVYEIQNIEMKYEEIGS